MLALLGGCAGETPSALSPGGYGARRVEGLWWLLFWISVGVVVTVIGLALWAAVTRRGPDVKAHHGDGQRFVVVAGIVIPAVILVGVFGAGLRDMNALVAPNTPADETIEVTGHLWWWEVRYPDRGVVTANEIHIPVGKVVHLRLQTADVNHSFWVPQLMPKTDLV